MPAQRFPNIAACLLVAALLGCNRPRADADATPAALAAAPAATQSTSTTRPLPVTQAAAYSADQLDLFEAVFRYQFRENVSGQRHVDYFFLWLSLSPDRRSEDYFPLVLNEADPPPELLRRFNDERTKVLGASLVAPSPPTHVRHRDFGRRGLIFYIADVVWVDRDVAEVRGGYYAYGLSSSGNTYRVERRGDRWVVTQDKMNWIS